MKTLRSWLGLVGVALGLGVGPVWAQYQVVHQFAGGPLDGGWPYDSLTIVGTNMYGMTYGGGSASCGVVASDLGILHTFTNGPGVCAYPLYGALAVAGATLYGMTTLGGTAGSCTLF